MCRSVSAICQYVAVKHLVWRRISSKVKPFLYLFLALPWIHPLKYLAETTTRIAAFQVKPFVFEDLLTLTPSCPALDPPLGDVITRGPKGHISCTWVQCVTFLRDRPRRTFLFTDRPKKQTWWRTLRSCFLSSFVKFRSAVSEEKSKMSQPIRCQGGLLVFPIGPKNTNLVEDVEILLPVKFRWIPFWFSGLRGGVENVSANQRPGRPSCFSDRPEKHKLGRGHWDLASC